MKKIIILDYSVVGVGVIYVFDFDAKIYEDGESFLIAHYDDYGFKESQCSWLIADNYEFNDLSTL